MMLCLLWKEFREHRSIWLTMVFMTGLLAYGMEQLLTSQVQSPAGTVGLTVFAMAAVYGVVCGSMMLAGEREGGTLVFLDIFLGRRGWLWFGKFLIGVGLVISEAVAVAAVLTFLNQSPPEWIARLMNRSERDLMALPAAARSGSDWAYWFLTVPLVTLEAYAWGLLASSWTKRVLASAGVALVLGFFVWWFTILIPPPASLVLRVLVLGGVLTASLAIFMTQVQEALVVPPLVQESPRSVVLREMAMERHLDRRDLALAQEGWNGLDDDIVVITPVDWAPAPTPPLRKLRRRDLPAPAQSPREVLLWLTLQQAWMPFLCLAAGCLLLGFFVPFAGAVLWPLATLLVGVACGTATFAWEQSDLSYQFLAAQHFPLRTIRSVKLVFWLAAAILAALLLLATGSFTVLVQSANRANAVVINRAPSGFHFGTLSEVMGPVSFFGIWLAYGFTAGQLCVLFCRKTVYAVVLGVMVSVGALGLWMPSLLCRGMGGWQLWLPPMGMVFATRLLLRAWAGGRLKERKPLVALYGFGLAMLAWFGLNVAVRTWEIPNAGAPLDRDEFKSALAKGNENPAGQRVLEALTIFEAPGPKKEDWIEKLAEATKLPPGILEAPSREGLAPTLRHLPVCHQVATDLRGRVTRELQRNESQKAFDMVAYILTLSRNMRHKAPAASYLAGVEVEASALEGLRSILAKQKLPPELPRRILEELNRHAAETPPPRDCLDAECYRAGGLLQYPTSWNATRTIPERWISNGVALSLDTPWEAERAARLWQAIWGGLYRAVDTPHWQLTEVARPLENNILAGWRPAATGPDQALSYDRLQRLLKASWLQDDRLFVNVVQLRSAANRARWRVDSARLTVALGMFQLDMGKPVAKLDELSPKYLPELPVDPYSGRLYSYRISKGELIEARPDRVELPLPMDQQLAPGQGVIWSTGPDRADDGGRRHAPGLPDDDPDWERGGNDLVAIVPRWSR